MKTLCFWLLIFLLFAMTPSCGESKPEAVTHDKTTAFGIPLKRKQRFSGNYNREFNDMQELHFAAAVANGIEPLSLRADTSNYKKQLVRLPDELELYKTYDLSHSIPFLVPSAARLFMQIAQNFRDSLYSKQIPLHKLYLTSVLRTDDDLSTLKTRNINASENSTHRYGTTFDISWKRFKPIDQNESEIAPERLKLVLAQVLFDLKSQEKCYVKHEKKQACFHVTVR